MQIYAEVIVAKFSPSEQAEYDELSALEGEPDLSNRRRNCLDSLDRRLMGSPGISIFTIKDVPIAGFKPLINARGLLLANRQISKELKETHWSKNTFLIRVQEDHPFCPPGRSFHDYVAPFTTQKAKNLYLDVTATTHQPGESGFQACVDTITRQLNDTVASLNRYGDRLDSLTVRYTSCFPGEIEDLRVDADGLAAHKQARAIWVMDPRNDKMSPLDHDEMEQLHLCSTAIADALCALSIPVSTFRIFGDISGPDLSRISRKFNIPVPQVVENLDKYGQRINERAEKHRILARNSSDAAMWLKMAKVQDQIFSTRALAVRKVTQSGLSSFDPEYHRRLAAARFG
jgi:hypothetical protein